MKVLYEKRFEKQYLKLSRDLQDKADIRIRLFAHNPFDPILGNHPLHGKYQEHRSINITGDYRAVYRMLKRDIAVFVTLGTHSELYG
ncbi:MAG: hypothetical protein JWN90_484 [Parcubacteria group bacterium]|nr:hypothetical protein [Parcubacteria group bacterium]